METIVATTDLSSNSKAGMRYAIQMAQRRGAQIAFVHVHYVIRGRSSNHIPYRAFVRDTLAPIEDDLSRFVRQVYKSMKLEPANMRTEVLNDFGTADSVIAFAKKVEASYVVISTRGAGLVRRLFGTNTSELIRKSPIPVVCIPSNYRFKPVKTLLYASDMLDYEAELKKVIAVAKPLAAEVELLHLTHPWELMLDKELAEKSLQKKVGYPVHLYYQHMDIDQLFVEQVADAIKATKADLLVMFTNQERSFFERVFMSSKAEEYSFRGKVPLLCFRKATKASL